MLCIQMAKNLSISPSVASLRFCMSIHIMVNILNMNISKNSYNENTFIFECMNSGNSHNFKKIKHGAGKMKKCWE